MRLGREVDDEVRVAPTRPSTSAGIGDVAVDEGDRVADRVQAGRVGRVGERVEHGDLRIGPVGQRVVDEVRADEAGAAGDENAHHGIPPQRSAS